MKEFEKWYDEYSYWAEINEEGLPLQISKDTWKAALKWAKKIARNLDCGDMEDSIDEELEGE